MVYEKREKHHSIQNVKKILNMSKPEIHPKWFPNAPVICEGKKLSYIGSTKPQLQLDVWLGNHPFYTNSQTLVDSEGRVERFMKKYGLQTKDN
jgi:large subunit ribosomal protein L31